MQNVIRKHHRRASALLDVVAASLVTAMVIVPSVNIMRRSMDVNNRVLLREEMTTRCGSLLEQQMADVSASFRSRKYNGRMNVFSEQLGYQVIQSDQSDFGGIPGQLMGISVTVWHDANRNRRLNSKETKYSLYTKVALAGNQDDRFAE